MRYERIEIDISVACCDQLLQALDRMEGPLTAGVVNLRNELYARLQRRDVDPHCPKNFPDRDWMDV